MALSFWLCPFFGTHGAAPEKGDSAAAAAGGGPNGEGCVRGAPVMGPALPPSIRRQAWPALPAPSPLRRFAILGASSVAALGRGDAPPSLSAIVGPCVGRAAVACAAPGPVCAPLAGWSVVAWRAPRPRSRRPVRRRGWQWWGWIAARRRVGSRAGSPPRRRFGWWLRCAVAPGRGPAAGGPFLPAAGVFRACGRGRGLPASYAAGWWTMPMVPPV